MLLYINQYKIVSMHFMPIVMREATASLSLCLVCTSAHIFFISENVVLIMVLRWSDARFAVRLKKYIGNISRHASSRQPVSICWRTGPWIHNMLLGLWTTACESISHLCSSHIPINPSLYWCHWSTALTDSIINIILVNVLSFPLYREMLVLVRGNSSYVCSEWKIACKSTYL